MMQNNQEKTENPNLFPIILHEGVHVVDSRLIAEALGIDHGNFMETVKKYQNDVENYFGAVPFQTEVLKHKTYKGSTQIKFALLNENQATFLATLSRNTPQVIAFKAKLVASFAVLRQDFAKVWELYQELTQELHAQEEWQNNNVTAIEDAMRFLLNYCNRLEKTVALLKSETDALKRQIQKQNTETGYLQAQIDVAQKHTQAQFDAMQKQMKALQEKQKDNKGELNKTTDRVDKIEEHLELKAVACVYLLFCPRKKWYKLGSSHDAKGRKRSFSTIEKILQLIIEIPTVSREEAYTLENALKKRFLSKHRQGEWYELNEDDLDYLRELADSNRKHLKLMA